MGGHPEPGRATGGVSGKRCYRWSATADGGGVFGVTGGTTASSGSNVPALGPAEKPARRGVRQE
jgi:hypothetical protein